MESYLKRKNKMEESKAVFFDESSEISRKELDKLNTGSSHAPGLEPMPVVPEEMTGISKQEAIAMYAGAGASDKSEREQKFVALFKARTIISHIGTMEERRIALKQLKRMKDLGLQSV